MTTPELDVPATTTVPTAPTTSTERPVAPSETIAEVAQRTGVTAHTLRYYERIGLLDVPRDHSGHRRYTPDDVDRVVFITRLRQTDMPIRDIQRYFELVEQGPSTESERLALMLARRDTVRAQLDALHKALDVVEYKITLYGGNCD